MTQYMLLTLIAWCLRLLIFLAITFDLLTLKVTQIDCFNVHVQETTSLLIEAPRQSGFVA